MKKVCLKSLGTFFLSFTFLFFFFFFVSFIFFYLCFSFFLFLFKCRRFNNNHLFSPLSLYVLVYPVLSFFFFFSSCHDTSHHTHRHTPGHKETCRGQSTVSHIWFATIESVFFFFLFNKNIQLKLNFNMNNKMKKSSFSNCQLLHVMQLVCLIKRYVYNEEERSFTSSTKRIYTCRGMGWLCEGNY